MFFLIKGWDLKHQRGGGGGGGGGYKRVYFLKLLTNHRTARTYCIAQAKLWARSDDNLVSTS